MSQKYLCGILSNGLVSSGGSLLFQEDKLLVNGGFLHNVTCSFDYNNIRCVVYTTGYPKMKIILRDKSEGVAVTLSHFQLKKLLAEFQKNGVACEKWCNQAPTGARLKKWWNFWFYQ